MLYIFYQIKKVFLTTVYHFSSSAKWLRGPHLARGP